MCLQKGSVWTFSKTCECAFDNFIPTAHECQDKICQNDKNLPEIFLLKISTFLTVSTQHNATLKSSHFLQCVWARRLCFCSRPSPACSSRCKKCELMSIGTTLWLISLSNIQLLCLKVKTKKQTSLDFYWFHQVLVLSFNTNTKISDRFAEAFHLRWHPWPQ